MAATLPAAWMETSASPDALAVGRARERQGLVNESTGQARERMDAIALRRVAAIHQTIFPGPHADALASV
jgi:hypothetical protein